MTETPQPTPSPERKKKARHRLTYRAARRNLWRKANSSRSPGEKKIPWSAFKLSRRTS